MPLVEHTIDLPLVENGDLHVTKTFSFGRVTATPRELRQTVDGFNEKIPAAFFDLSELPEDVEILGAEFHDEVSDVIVTPIDGLEDIVLVLFGDVGVGSGDDEIYSGVVGGFPLAVHAAEVGSYQTDLGEFIAGALDELRDAGFVAIGRRFASVSATMEVQLGSTSPVLRVRYLAEGPATRGYRLWIDRADGVVGEPVEMEAGVLSYAEALAALALEPFATYRVRLAAFNAVGQSEPIELHFRTDGEGLPRLLPSVVRQVAAVPLADGQVRVVWNYEERHPEFRADEFVIRAVSLDGGDDVYVGGLRVALAPQHAARIELPDGLWLVMVFAARGGAWNENVTGAPVLVRSAAPVGEIVGLMAE